MAAVKRELRPAWRNYWGGFLIAGMLMLGALGFAVAGGDEGLLPLAAALFLAGLIVLVSIVFKRFSWKFTIEDTRVSRHYGIISRNQQSVRIDDLRSIELDQSLFQRIFGVGDLAFYSAGSADAEVRFFGISKPLQVRDQIDRLRDGLKGSDE